MGVNFACESEIIRGLKGIEKNDGGIYMNWLLLIVLGILVINALIGMKVGLIKTIFSLCSMVVALILTIWLSPMVNDFMKGNEKIFDSFSSKVEKILPFEEEQTDASKQVSIIEDLPLPKSLKDSLIENNNAQAYEALSINSFKEYVNNYLTGVIINATAFIVTFIIILILLWVLSIALDIISKLPILKQINKTAGLLAGLVHGLIVVWVFFILITVFGSSDWGQKAMAMISDSQVLSILYDNNYLVKFITSATKILF